MCTVPTPSCPSAPTLPQPLVPPQHSWWLQQWVSGVGPTTAKAQGWAHWEGKESQCQIRVVRKLSWGQREGKASFPPTVRLMCVGNVQCFTRAVAVLL